MNYKRFLLIYGTFFFGFMSFCLQAHAMTTEIGLDYGFKKTTFNATNYTQSEYKSATLSFYLWDKIALELSYTDSFYESQENDSTVSRVLQQTSDMTGGDIIFILTDQHSDFQPYIKGGAAYIHRKETVKYPNADAYDIPTTDGIGPSAGAGIKYNLNDRLSIKMGYDVWKTPADGGQTEYDSSFHAGLSWFL